MAINVLNSKWIALALLSLAGISGCCCQAVPLPGECDCPTDARRLYLTCGEEAVRRCPCGPSHEYYGLKPTCWREWPEGWHCNGCEGFPYRESCGEPVADTHVDEAPASAEIDLSNPFRSKPGAAELPLLPQKSETAPTQSAPAKSTPVQLPPVQPAPTAPPALEKIPMETAPAKEAPTETVPSAKTSTTDKPTVQATSATVAPPVAPVQPAAPQLMPVVPVAVKMTAAPILIPPQNAPTTASAAEVDPKPVQVAAAPKEEKQQADKKTEVSTTADGADNPALSKRVEQHLFNNLQL